jgi:hypothetical protein
MIEWVKTIDEMKLGKPTTWYQAFTSGQLNSGRFTGHDFGWSVEADYVWHNGQWLGFRT